MSDKARNWVWVASTQTVEAGKLSVLACVETVVMVAIYWAIAWIWNTHLHLLVGVLVMPLMLFRSDESVALGLKWAEYAERATDGVLLPGLHATNALAGTFLIAFVGVDSVPVVFGMLITAVAIILSAPILTRYFVYAPAKSLRVAIRLSGLPSFALGTTLVLLFAPFVIRVCAPILYLAAGGSQAVRNWHRILLQTDIFVAPEALPGTYGKDTFWSLNTLFDFMSLAPWNKSSWEGVRAGPALKATVFVTAPIVSVGLSILIFVPTYFFRWALKSTAWFYLPLLFLTAPYDGGSRIIWMRSFSNPVIAWIRFILALIGVGVALAALVVDLPSALAALRFGQEMELPIVPLSLFLVLDWDRLHPWQYVSLPAAMLTILLFLRLDVMRRREQAGAVIAETGFALRSMVWADRLRSICALAWLALITPPTLRFFHCAGQLPDWAARPLAWVFGPEACIVPLAS